MNITFPLIAYSFIWGVVFKYYLLCFEINWIKAMHTNAWKEQINKSENMTNFFLVYKNSYGSIKFALTVILCILILSIAIYWVVIIIFGDITVIFSIINLLMTLIPTLLTATFWYMTPKIFDKFDIVIANGFENITNNQKDNNSTKLYCTLHKILCILALLVFEFNRYFICDNCTGLTILCPEIDDGICNIECINDVAYAFSCYNIVIGVYYGYDTLYSYSLSIICDGKGNFQRATYVGDINFHCISGLCNEIVVYGDYANNILLACDIKSQCYVTITCLSESNVECKGSCVNNRWYLPLSEVTDNYCEIFSKINNNNNKMNNTLNVWLSGDIFDENINIYPSHMVFNTIRLKIQHKQ